MAELTAEDKAQIETYRATATREETAQFAAELYKLRNTGSGQFFSTFPRWIILLIAIWFGLLETAEKLPMLMLAYPRYQAALAEAQVKVLQPDLVIPQITKANNDALASAFQADMARTQLEKARNDALASVFQPDTAKAQLDRARLDAITAQYQPELTAAQQKKTKLEAQAAEFQPQISQLQLAKLGVDTKVALAQLPVAQQGIALSGLLLGVINSFVGIPPPSDTQPVTVGPTTPSPSTPTPAPTAASSSQASPVQQRYSAFLKTGNDGLSRNDCKAVKDALSGIDALDAKGMEPDHSAIGDDYRRYAKYFFVRAKICK